MGLRSVEIEEIMMQLLLVQTDTLVAVS